MNYSENRKDLATIADAYRMRAQAKKDYEKGLQDLEENSMYSIGYKREMAQKAKQELEKKVAEYNSLMTEKMAELINGAYSVPLTVDSSFTELLNFIRSCGPALTKEQVKNISTGYQGDIQKLKLVENVCKSCGIDVSAQFEESFYFDKSDVLGSGNIKDGYTADEYLQNWQNTVLRGDDSTFGYFFNETARKLGENIESPVHMQEFEAPPIL